MANLFRGRFYAVAARYDQACVTMRTAHDTYAALYRASGNRRGGSGMSSASGQLNYILAGKAGLVNWARMNAI